MGLKKILGIAGRVVKGVGDSALFGIPSAITSGKNHEDGGEGKADIPKIIGYISYMLIAVLIALGKVENEQGTSLLKQVAKFVFFNG
tara:strand:+ start:2186 stop:2446 length:261 start_codon:yes stop_codon:yes gene_type:complete